MKGILSETLLCIILLIAAFLRFKGAEVYMQDELSAISRAQFGSLSELIQKGVLTDYHPALMQIWTYFWNGLVGDGEYLNKLPPIFAGLLSIKLLYDIARSTYGRKVALFSAALMATVQYFILYSTLSRPYSFGLLFCLWQVALLVKAVHHPERGLSWKWMLVAMLLSAWTHYFSMLFSAIAGVGSFLLLSKKDRMAHLKAVVGASLLYLPHMPITLHHMRKGDLARSNGWLGAPDDDFLFDFFAYLFQYNRGLILAMIVLSILALVSLWKMEARPRKLTLFFLITGLLPYVLGHIYSLTVGPILQFSLLIFGAPVLLLALVSPLRKVNFWIVGIGLLVMLLSNIYVLHSHRHHYDIMARQPLSYAVERIMDFNEKGERPLVFTTVNKGFFAAYSDRYELDFDHMLITDSARLSEFDQRLLNSPNAAIIMVNAPRSFQQHMLHHREGGERWEGNRGSVTISHPSVTYPLIANKDIGFDLRDQASIPMECDIKRQAKTAKEYRFNRGAEWGPGCRYPLDKILDEDNSIIHLRIDFADSLASKNIVAVMELKSKEDLVEWRGLDWEASGVRGSIYNSWNLESVLNTRDEPLDLVVYLWNKDKKERVLYAFDIAVETSSPDRFSLYEALPAD